MLGAGVWLLEHLPKGLYYNIGYEPILAPPNYYQMFGK